MQKNCTHRVKKYPQTNKNTLIKYQQMKIHYNIQKYINIIIFTFLKNVALLHLKINNIATEAFIKYQIFKI
jgi:hypothetical protein